MFSSCRLCQEPTDKWQDFCNDCATRKARPLLRLIQGGRSDAERTDGELAKGQLWLQPVSSDSNAS